MPNFEDKKVPVLSYRADYINAPFCRKFINKYLAYALLNKEFVVFEFNERINAFIKQDLFDLKSGNYLEVAVKWYDGCYDMKIIRGCDEFYNLEKNKELTKHIISINKLSISQCLEEQKLSVAETDIEMPNMQRWDSPIKTKLKWTQLN